MSMVIHCLSAVLAKFKVFFTCALFMYYMSALFYLQPTVFLGQFWLLFHKRLFPGLPQDQGG